MCRLSSFGLTNQTLSLGDHRFRLGYPEAQRRRKVRHHHPRRGTCGRIRPQEDVALTQRNHQEHPRRYRLQGTHHLQNNPKTRTWMDQANLHW